MKFIHLSDLHLGKRLNEYSLIEDQRYVLAQILKIIDGERPQAVILAGDIYDKSIPSAEAVQLFDGFLTELAARKLQVFVISGNHDSPERLAFGASFISASGIHLSPVYSGTVTPITLTDEYGPLNVYLLPFIKPANVRRFATEELSTYTEALHYAVSRMEIDPSLRNVLVTHQFVTGATRSDSEEITVGGTENVDGAVFSAFDYVALGHIHSPQNCGAPNLRYCGTPLKYSFSEEADQKSVTVVTLKEKGNLTVTTLPLSPLRDMKTIKGTFASLTQKSFYENTTLPTDYLNVVLTDEEEVLDAASRLGAIYQNVMHLSYDNRRTRALSQIGSAEQVESKTDMQLFSEFYLLQNGSPLQKEQEEFLLRLMEEIEEEQA